MVDNVPRLLAGRYEVGELIGRGGMAEVHIGYDSRLSRTVAIKLLRADLASDQMLHARFRREAQSAASLNHPAIVAVFDTGEETFTAADGSSLTLPYIVMEYVEGHTVRELLKDGAAVPIDEAVEIMVGVLGALEYAHNEMIVHRDIKPGNIMLTPTGKVKVMDFGIARAMADNSATMTQTNSVVGTAQYLSPEQARGETVDQRSDIYSAGCVLYELLTGKPPFTGDSAVSVAYQHVREVPPVPSSIAPDIPDTLDRIVMKSLAKERDQRYQDAAEFRSDLLTMLAGGSITAPPATQWLPVAVGTGAGQTAVMQPSQPTTVMPPSGNNGNEALSRTGTIAPIDDDTPVKNRWWIWLLALLALIGIGVGIWALTKDPPAPTTATVPAPTTATVPDVAGMSQAEAAAAIQDVGLVYVDGGTVFSDTVESGLAVNSDPDANTEVDLDSSVTVYFSSGPEQVRIPSLTDMTLDEATQALEDAGFQVGTVTDVNAPGIAEGIVSTSDPEQGTEQPKGSVVNLEIGTGLVDLTEMAGRTQADAEALLAELQLTNVQISPQPSDSVPSGTVIEMSPAAGGVPINAAVTLVVSSGAANQAPTITISGPTNVSLTQGATFDPRAGVTASDPEDGDLTSQIEILGLNNFTTAQPGQYFLTYVAYDSQGVSATVERQITVTAAGPGQNNGQNP